MKCVHKARNDYEHVASYFKICPYKRKLQPLHYHLYSYVFICSIPLWINTKCDLDLRGRDTLSWYFKFMWQVILRSVHTRHSYSRKTGSPDTQTDSAILMCHLKGIKRLFLVTHTGHVIWWEYKVWEYKYLSKKVYKLTRLWNVWINNLHPVTFTPMKEKMSYFFSIFFYSILFSTLWLQLITGNHGPMVRKTNNKVQIKNLVKEHVSTNILQNGLWYLHNGWMTFFQYLQLFHQHCAMLFQQ